MGLPSHPFLPFPSELEKKRQKSNMPSHPPSHGRSKIFRALIPPSRHSKSQETGLDTC
ncbi:hypothetical protein E2C01_062059 [Portunus trituberculatus]|uniref:Uncharacterized protein n=1 Tax=Portunus trituberculatus TaxID=210409 RepID=A0A5B7HCL0_PORTR|nr:hypothetical protein [Portunus trituberculatus]